MPIESPPIDVAEQCAGIATSFWNFANEVADGVGTPFYVYFPHRATAAYHCFASGMQDWGIGHIAFSVKTNPLFAMLKDLRLQGAFAEVVSAWELQHAIAMGFHPQQIVLNGPMKAVRDLRETLETPMLTVNVDSLDELDAINDLVQPSMGRINVGLRVCPPMENGAWSRFGVEISTGEFAEALSRIRKSRLLALRCIHFHLGTQVHDLSRYVEMIGIVREIWARYSLSSDIWLDIGGGFPYDHAVPFEEQAFVPSSFFLRSQRPGGHRLDQSCSPNQDGLSQRQRWQWCLGY